MRANSASNDSSSSLTLQNGVEVHLCKTIQIAARAPALHSLQEGQTEIVQTALLSPKLELPLSPLKPFVLLAKCFLLCCGNSLQGQGWLVSYSSLQNWHPTPADPWKVWRGVTSGEAIGARGACCPPVLGVTGDTEALRLGFARKREREGDGFSGGDGARILNWERKFLSPLPTNWLMTQGPGPCPGLACNGRGLQHPESHSSENTCPAPWECQAMIGLAVLVRMRWCVWGGVRLFLEEMATRLWPGRAVTAKQ